jgi:hypothetical protein
VQPQFLPTPDLTNYVTRQEFDKFTSTLEVKLLKNTADIDRVTSEHLEFTKENILAL